MQSTDSGPKVPEYRKPFVIDNVLQLQEAIELEYIKEIRRYVLLLVFVALTPLVFLCSFLLGWMFR